MLLSMINVAQQQMLISSYAPSFITRQFQDFRFISHQRKGKE